MANADELKSKREEARRALAGEERYAAMSKAATDTSRRRRDAARAMEGEHHRHRRESLEQLTAKRAAATAAAAKREAETMAAQKAAVAAKAAAATAAATAKTKAHQQEISKIHHQENTIETLKQAISSLNPLRTLKSDLARAVQEEGLSIAQIAMSEQAKRLGLGGQAVSAHQPGGQQSRLAIIITLVLMAAVASLTYLVVFRTDSNQNPAIETVPTPTSLIFSELSQPLDLSSATTTSVAIKQLLDATANKIAFRQPAVENIFFTRQGQILNWPATVQALKLNLPDRLQRNLLPEFMLGIYFDGQTNQRFLVLTTKTYDQIYAGMLAWENTGLVNALLPWLYSGQRLNDTANNNFIDRRVSNKDLRVIKDSGGQPVLVYGFLDQTTLWIGTNEATFSEIFKRYVTAN